MLVRVVTEEGTADETLKALLDSCSELVGDRFDFRIGERYPVPEEPTPFEDFVGASREIRDRIRYLDFGEQMTMPAHARYQLGMDPVICHLSQDAGTHLVVAHRSFFLLLEGRPLQNMTSGYVGENEWGIFEYESISVSEATLIGVPNTSDRLSGKLAARQLLIGITGTSCRTRYNANLCLMAKIPNSQAITRSTLEGLPEEPCTDCSIRLSLAGYS